MNPYAIPSILSFLPFLFLGLAAVLQSRREKSNLLLSVACLANAFFVAMVGVFHLATSREQALFWNKWPYLFMFPACLLTFLYVLEISDRSERLQEKILGLPVSFHCWLVYLVLGVNWLIVLFTDLLIRSVHFYPSTGWEHTYGPLFWPFQFTCYYYLAFLVIILYRGLQGAFNPIERTFRTISLASVGTGYIVAYILGIHLPMIGVQFHSLAPLAFLVMSFGLTYGLMRKQWETVWELNVGLEEKVAERTRELARTNETLVNAKNQITKYIDRNVAEKIFEGEFAAELTHRRIKLTLFFSDIKDFTQFTDSADPEEVAKLLNEYLGEMAQIVRRWGGTIPQFTGDSIFAIFGAPDSLGVREDALACVRMAIDMQARMKELRVKWWNEGVQFPFEIRCGIHTGMANVGNYGSDGFMEYSAIGLNTNLASRLEQICQPGQVFISHATWALINNEIPCEEVGAIEVKGFHYPVQTYRVLQDMPREEAVTNH